MGEFEQLLGTFDAEVAKARAVLVEKNRLYHTEEGPLTNIYLVASLTGVTPVEAVLNLMAKHIATLYSHRGAVPDEVIADIHNYLVILKFITQPQFDTEA